MHFLKKKLKKNHKKKNETKDKLIHRQNLYNNTDLTPYNASGNIYIENFEIKYK